MVLKICIASDGDTLFKIAKKYDIELEQLVSLNPHIRAPYRDITGLQIKLPSWAPFSKPSAPLHICPVEPLPEYLDHWIPLTSLEQMARTHYDVVIVGTGAGGGAVLWRLCEKWGKSGKRIGVIEAGDLLLPTNAQNIATLDAERYVKYWSNPKFWKKIGESQPACPIPDFIEASFPLAFQQFLALGGRTLIWNAVSPRMHPTEIMKWPIPLKEMDYYYRMAEKVMSVTRNYSQGSLLTQKLLERLQTQGFPEAEDMPVAVDLGQTKYGEIHSNVFFSSMLFLARALNQRPFDLTVRACAVQVLTEKGRAAGVRVMSPDKKSYDISAETVVLSASTLETPRILLNSGIQGEAVGHYLTNHSRVVGNAIISRLEFPEVLGTLNILIPQTDERPYQIQMYGPGQYYWYHYKTEPLQQEWGVNFQASGKVESRYENYVSLDPETRDEYGMPELQVCFSYNNRDLEVIRKMAEGVKQASHAMNATLLTNGGSEVCLRLPGEEIHEMGTCRMGDDSRHAAVNRYGEVFGVSGLFVADNSVIPASGAANPTLTTVALAIRTADYIQQTS
ncbi:GMC oxidoreductase [Paenibacillus sedimenti]|uniref:GMC family oxidoreductase N-terminal domain-containing protein n=1 Tax=Paenibacillus sedimenti TaxID=2770274 RepID=A0A926QMM2_9BACL|nr:GMC oxidoreductase [Paenibacillus sedimenti]MBD0384073.1 GMC family oxidoreductase N-terminal domain-containing protein [Paenibacillus sedimenti]